MALFVTEGYEWIDFRGGERLKTVLQLGLRLVAPVCTQPLRHDDAHERD